MNAAFWRFEPPPRSEWECVRKVVLERDDYRCRFCGHRSLKKMHVHHLSRGDVHIPRNLATCCVACHAVLHIGLNLQFGAIEIWKCDLSQLQIVRRTRNLIREGLSLREIKKALHLTRGELSCKSVGYANSLLLIGGRRKRISLPEPYKAVFVKFKTWQLD